MTKKKKKKSEKWDTIKGSVCKCAEIKILKINKSGPSYMYTKNKSKNKNKDRSGEKIRRIGKPNQSFAPTLLVKKKKCIAKVKRNILKLPFWKKIKVTVVVVPAQLLNENTRATTTTKTTKKKGGCKMENETKLSHHFNT